MIDINMNSVGGHFKNSQLVMGSNTFLIDRNKVANHPSHPTNDESINGYIWIIPLEREKIPSDMPSFNLPNEILDLATRLEDYSYEEVDINYDGDKVGGGIRFYAKKIDVNDSFEGSYPYQGEAIVIKKLN